MKALKIIAIVILVLVAIIVILGLIGPKESFVERSVVIDAPRELMFDHVKYWRNWGAWSPWGDKDSTMKITVTGTDGEVGSMYKWAGDPNITGTGEMTNTGVKELEEMTFDLHFITPWESFSTGFTRLEDEGGKTKVTWGYAGKNPFPWNIMMLFMSMDNMLGPDFERGLELLKGIAEKEAEAVASYEVETITFKAKTYAAIRKQVNFADMQGFYAKSFGSIRQAIKSKRARMAGAPAGLYYTWDEQAQTTDVAAAIPVTRTVTSGDVKTETIPMSTAYVINYTGPYENLGPAHKALDLYLKKNGLKQKAPVIEEYITDPGSEPDPNKWLTRIYYFAE